MQNIVITEVRCEKQKSVEEIRLYFRIVPRSLGCSYRMTNISFLDSVKLLKIEKCICLYSYWHSVYLIDYFILFLNLIHIFRCSWRFDFGLLSIFHVVKNIASNLCIGFLITVTGHIVTLHLFSSKVLKVKEFHPSLTGSDCHFLLRSTFVAPYVYITV